MTPTFAEILAQRQAEAHFAKTDIPTGGEPLREVPVSTEANAIKMPGATAGTPPPRVTEGTAIGVEPRKNPDADRAFPDVPLNTFCTVFRGVYAGRYGVYSDIATRFSDGTPDTVVVQTRDADDMRIVVDYADIKIAQSGGR